MVKIKKRPQVFIGTIIDNATDHMDDERANRVNSVRQNLIDMAAEYDSLAQRGELYLIEPHSSVGTATYDDLMALYEQKFVSKKGPNRDYYGYIKALAPDKMCPYCQQRTVYHLDHFLPKTQYLGYTVTPYNLVPSCEHCNGGKSTYQFDDYEDQLFHPYYDDFDCGIWLKAKMIQGDPPAFTFYADPDASFDPVTQKRIKKSFSTEGFKLNEVYSDNSGSEFRARHNRMKKSFVQGGKAYAVAELEKLIDDESVNGNNIWKVALYRAMIECDWYWDTYLPQEVRDENNVPVV